MVNSRTPCSEHGQDTVNALLFWSCERDMLDFCRAKRVAASKAPADIRVAQLSAIFRQMPIALGVNVINAAITALVLQQFLPAEIPFGWFCLILLMTGGAGRFGDGIGFIPHSEILFTGRGSQSAVHCSLV
jgi:hypothetical protein